MNKPLTILSTKKLKSSVKELLLQNHFQLIEDDWIEIEYIVSPGLKNQIDNSSDALVFTSRHAVEGLLRNSTSILKDKKVFCLNGETLRATENLQLPIVATAKDAPSLASKIIESKTSQVSFFCGNLHRQELPELLRKNNIAVDEITTYNTILSPKKNSSPSDFVLFFSPSGAESFFQSNAIGKSVICFCIGDTTSKYVGSKISNKIIIAKEPSQESVAEALLNFIMSNKTIHA